MDLDTNNTHTQTLTTENGETVPVQFECVQKDTIHRLFTIQQTNQRQLEDFTKQLISRDQKIKDAFDQTNQSIQNLTYQLQERKQINGHTQTEINRLEDSDGDVYKKIDDLSRSVNQLEGNTRILIVVVPIMFTVILAIQAILFYSFLQHIAVAP